MDKFKSVLVIVQNHQATLEIAVVALLTAAGEKIFTVVVFECPCNSWNLSYGMVFLLVPALVLLVSGFLISNKTWKFFTGLCCCESPACDLECKDVLQMFMQIVTKAMVAPLSWIAVALLNGSFYECARTGLANMTLFLTNHPCFGKPQECESELHKFPCETSNLSLQPMERDAVLEIIRSESQVIGWLLIASIITVALGFTCLARGCLQASYMQLKFLQVYTHKEDVLMARNIAEHAEKLAARNLTSFFQGKLPEPIGTPVKEAWKRSSAVFFVHDEIQHYSALHEYVEKLKNDTTSGSQPSPAAGGHLADSSL